MYDSAVEMQGGFYGPLTNIWVERIKAARQSKTRFNLVAKTCNDFYESQRGFMWNDKPEVCDLYRQGLRVRQYHRPASVLELRRPQGVQPERDGAGPGTVWRPSGP